MENAMQGTTYLESPLIRLSKDLKAAAMMLSDAEARYLVDSYYQIQDIRVAQGNQVFSMTGKSMKTLISERHKEGKEPSSVLEWFTENAMKLEEEIRKALDAYSEGTIAGRWAKSQYGIGPVLAAGILAHCDLNPWSCEKFKLLVKANPKTKEKPCNEDHPHDGFGCGRKRILYAGQLWNFAGIGDPNRRWEEGQRRPWNARLKTLCWKIGQSFLKVSTNENAFYGLLLRNYWEQLKARNEKLEFAPAAKDKLDRYKIGTDTDAYGYYSVGKLPPAHVLQRACRYAVKMFLSHYHYVAYSSQFGEQPALPYIIAVGGHKDYIAPPNWPME